MSHFYDQEGNPHHFVPKKDGSGNRPSTIKDCRANGWLPSVTTVLNILRKPGLENWMITQAVHAVVTAPNELGESLDAKIIRVLETERQQDEEARIARDLGTDIHNGLEALFKGEQIHDDLRPWIEPAYLHLRDLCKPLHVERVLVGDGYAGKCDLIGEMPSQDLILDWKTTKKLPEKKSWPEHVYQCSAYAAAWHNESAAIIPSTIPLRPIATANCYISTLDCGKFAFFFNPDWQQAYLEGFAPLVRHWRYANL